MVADVGSLIIQRARLRDGRVCDILVEDGRVIRFSEICWRRHRADETASASGGAGDRG